LIFGTAAYEKIGSMKAINRHNNKNNNMCYEHTSIGRDMRVEFPSMDEDNFKQLVANRVAALSKSTNPDDKAYYNQIRDEALFGTPKPNTTRKPPRVSSRLQALHAKTGSAWQSFQKQYRPVLKNKHKGLKGGQITKQLGEDWKQLKLHFPEMVQRYSSAESEDPELDELCKAFKKIDLINSKPAPKIKSKVKVDYAAQELAVKHSRKRKFSKLFPQEVAAAALAASFDDSSMMVDDASAESGGDEQELPIAAAPISWDAELEESIIKSNLVDGGVAVDPQVWATPTAGASGWRSKKLEAERSRPKTFCKDWGRDKNTKVTLAWFRGIGKNRCALKPTPNYTVGSRNILSMNFYEAVNDPANKVSCRKSGSTTGYTITITHKCTGSIVELELEHGDFPHAA
jgi:hypothetical protein